MGLIRKTMSISTMGMIDLRSDKERIARSTRQTAKATRASLKLAKEQARTQARPQVVYPAATSGPSRDVVERLRQLGELRNAGTITEEEFNRLKADLIG
jgi:hypothetical protein